MDIEFFTDEKGTHNVRFPGDAYANNEVILGVFYDCFTLDHLKKSISDIEEVLNGKLDFFEFGDGVDVELEGQHTILRAALVKSKAYRLKTVELKNVLELWVKFHEERKPHMAKTISIDAERT